MNPTVLILGADGQVGTELMKAPWPAGTRLIGAIQSDADFLDADALFAYTLSQRPALVVNAAAHTAVDRAENEREASFAINATAPRALARAARELGIPLIHISTDYVFDGTRSDPYREGDPVSPLGVYGASKAAGEEAVRQTLEHHILLRTAWVFSAHGHNFVKTMLRLGRERSQLKVVADQHGGPTAAADIAAALATMGGRILTGGAVSWGTFHFCGAPPTTWYGFTREILERALPPGSRPELLPITTADYPTPARRPANSVLDCRRIGGEYGIVQPDWRLSLQRVLDQLATGG